MSTDYREEVHLVREVIWAYDPLSIGDGRIDVPDEYDDIAWRIASARHRASEPEDVEKLWVAEIQALGVQPDGVRPRPFQELLEEYEGGKQAPE